MSVGLDADTDWANRNTNLGGLGISGWTLAGWCYRVSGVGYAATALSAICAVANTDNGRHVSLRYNNNFGSGTENDPQLIIEDNGGPVVTFGASDDQMPFDTWCFCYIRSGASGGTVEASWTSDDGDTWHTASGTNTTESSVQGNTVLLGRGNFGDAQTMRGYYAYWQAFGSDIGQTAARALITKSASDSTEWAFWRLASNTDTADTSGNSRTLTFNGSFTSEADPTIPGGGGFTPRSMLLGVG
jgi:hypothetical protein